MKPLREHALEMLRLINIHSDAEFAGYWLPGDKNEIVVDQIGSLDVFVHGTSSTGAIQTLTKRGLVAEVPGAMQKWSRRVTPAGRAFLATHYAAAIRERERLLRRLRTKSRSDDSDDDL